MNEEYILKYQDNYNYSFATGNPGIAFALIYIGATKEIEDIYVKGNTLIENISDNMDKLDDDDILLFINSLIFLFEKDYIEIEEDFFYEIDLKVFQSYQDNSKFNLRLFLLIFYLKKRYTLFGKESIFVNSIVRLCSEIIIQLHEIMLFPKNLLNYRHYLFLYYSDLLLQLFSFTGTFKPLGNRIKSVFCNVLNSHSLDLNEIYILSKNIYLSEIQDTAVVSYSKSLSSEIQSYFFQNDIKASFNSYEEIKFNQGVLNSSLGIDLIKSKNNLNDHYFFNFLFQYNF